MSAVHSISRSQRYGIVRVCRVWDVSRATLYRTRARHVTPPGPRSRPGPIGPMPDQDLVERIRAVLINSPFHGEGYRKVWARLRNVGVRTSKERVRRLMREHDLAAARAGGTPRGTQAHDGTIIPEGVDQMCGTDMTAAVTTQDGQAAVFIAINHFTAECVGIHAAKRGTRFKALGAPPPRFTGPLRRDLQGCCRRSPPAPRSWHVVYVA